MQLSLNHVRDSRIKTSLSSFLKIERRREGYVPLGAIAGGIVGSFVLLITAFFLWWYRHKYLPNLHPLLLDLKNCMGVGPMTYNVIQERPPSYHLSRWPGPRKPIKWTLLFTPWKMEVAGGIIEAAIEASISRIEQQPTSF